MNGKGKEPAVKAGDQTQTGINMKNQSNGRGGARHTAEPPQGNKHSGSGSGADIRQPAESGYSTDSSYHARNRKRDAKNKVAKQQDEESVVDQAALDAAAELKADQDYEKITAAVDNALAASLVRGSVLYRLSNSPLLHRLPSDLSTLQERDPPLHVEVLAAMSVAYVSTKIYRRDTKYRDGSHDGLLHRLVCDSLKDIGASPLVQAAVVERVMEVFKGEYEAHLTAKMEAESVAGGLGGPPSVPAEPIPSKWEKATSAMSTVVRSLPSIVESIGKMATVILTVNAAVKVLKGKQAPPMPKSH